MRARLFVAAVLGAAVFGAAGPPAAQAQDDLRAVANRVRARMAQASPTGDVTQFGWLTGLWKSRTGALNEQDPKHLRSFTQFQNVFIYYIVDSRTGDLGEVGYAEWYGHDWRGWFSVGCRGCCPAESWWARGVMGMSQDWRNATIRISTKHMDPRTCRLTDDPDVFDVEIEQVRSMRFREFLPGKIIHLVGAPAVGNQPSQYKAAVAPQWDLRGTGVSRVTLVVRGGERLEDTPRVAGEHQFVTTRAGLYRFQLVGYNRQNRLVHAEWIEITIPPIRGIN